VRYVKTLISALITAAGAYQIGRVVAAAVWPPRDDATATRRPAGGLGDRPAAGTGGDDPGEGVGRPAGVEPGPRGGDGAQPGGASGGGAGEGGERSASADAGWLPPVRTLVVNRPYRLELTFSDPAGQRIRIAGAAADLLIGPGKWHLLDDESFMLIATRAVGNQIQMDARALSTSERRN